MARVVLGGLIVCGPLRAQAPAANKLWPNLESNIERPLRYRPDGGDFVIENGAEFFNRPLYGGNTAFRVDGGDKPEFVLYLPGRGGNLRLGVRSAAGARWLHEAASITTRYRPGELLYEIRDPLLGPTGVLRLAVVAWPQVEGLAVRAEGEGLAPGLELVWAYGGVNGQRGTRDGDIGTEKVPISEWFQLQPEFCRDNRVELGDGAFTLRAPLPRDQAATIHGLGPAGSRLTVGDAGQWNDLPTLLSAVFIRAPDRPVVVGRVALANTTPLYLSFQRLGPEGTAPDLDTYREVGAPKAPTAEKRVEVNALHREDLPAAFAATEAHFAALRDRVKVETPDPYLNAAVGALNVAADAVWDEPQQAIMHGAIAWRTKLLGWRGPYALDALGWPERARKNFEYWATRQNTDPIPAKLPPPDEKSNLARSEAALHSNGDLSNSHYDMNLVFIDALFRHLLWTGDLEFARKMWPVIERHLAWERRLFRREFTTPAGEKLPLYEAYAAIWASDDLQYSGGGTAHASAYNYWHNKMAARIAPLAGAGAGPYIREADLIARGMRELLWVEKTSMFGEYKDWLGEQLVHPDAAIWSFYHIMDSGLPTQKEADGLSAYASMYLPWLPVGQGGMASGYVIGSSNWMPYTWSLNNVVFGESMHGALGLWQANSAPAAWVAMRGTLMASMFAGICPGNVGSMTYHDVYRRESQRDFADGSGTFSRALVEGLFGVRPDAMKGELLVVPGFPHAWSNASIEHPDFSLTFQGAKGPVSRYRIESRFGREMSLRFQAPTWGFMPLGVRVNGQKVEGRRMGIDLWSRFEFVAPAAKVWEVEIDEPSEGLGRELMINTTGSGDTPPDILAMVEPDTLTGRAECIDLAPYFNDCVTKIFQPGKYHSPRSPFVSLSVPSQGIGYWAGHVNATAEIDDTGLRATAARNDGKITLPNGVPFVTPGPGDTKNILFTSQWDNYPRAVTVPLTGKAHRLRLLMAGSTNAMQSRFDNGEVVVTYTDGTTERLALSNPETWWPIEQDYFTDDYQFRIDLPFGAVLATRVDLKTGEVRVLDRKSFKGQGRIVPGGAATALTMDLNPDKELKSLTVRALANDVVIGLMAATLER